MLSEFKKFATQGNVMDLAVGVIIGGAFGKIIASLVGDILMPLIGLILGGVNFNNIAVTVGNASVKYGAFIQATIDFTIIAFVIFMLVRAMNSMKKPAPAALPRPRSVHSAIQPFRLKQPAVLTVRRN